ncbi:integrase [Aminobacter ciceronei]|uniref:Integrase n=1 Tax=Aminobacter ciceronei TaxID=150723 RepID=A0ABR6C9H9_9HYPH|nr:integrase [Aminobacter ciceronei]MBA8907893.1 integrase [Aminobacter ciceronei]MBA9021665.1 integrase [Aminobacter ciceronei]
MAGNVRNLLNREGRYFARLVIPKELRPFMNGKTELRTALGPDRREALKKLPGAVAILQHEIALGERRAVAAGEKTVTLGRYPLAVDQIALRNYHDRLAQDDQMRNAGRHWASLSIDDGFVDQLRRGIAGQLSNADLAELVEHRIDRFRQIGNTTAEPGTAEWRTLARAVCISEYEALERVAERDDGDFTGRPSNPLIVNAAPVEDELPPVSLKRLLADYIAAKKIVGKAKGTEKRWKPVFDDLVRFTRHDDARRLTKQNLMQWRDERLKTLSPKTVSDVYLASVRAVLRWAKENDRIDSNVAAEVRQDAPKRALSREKGFTLSEAQAILKAACVYVPKASDNPANSELPQTSAAKRWTPILCAHTGARVTEMTQLRKQDIRQEGDAYVLRITPDAGTVKAGGYRDVPLHQQLIDMGFLDFVDASPGGALFYPERKGRDPVKAAQTVAGRVSKWLQGDHLIPDGIQPNHAWRHRFKTVSNELGISERVSDAIQGHAGRTAGDGYGDVTVKARKAAIDRMPKYEI